MSLILIGSLASLAAGLATALGALPVLFSRNASVRTENAMLGFAAGVMTSASFLSLILPAMEHARDAGAGTALAGLIVAAGILLGAAAVHLINEYVPHEHFILGREGGDPAALGRIWLFVMAITLHNFPEGMAVGVGYGGGDIAKGNVLALGIGLQNIPEGLAVAVALVANGYSRRFAFGTATLTGLVEPVGGLIGAGAVALASTLLPWGLAFAAGAMLYIISHEIIPETHRRGFQNAGTVGFLIGLVAMFYLDATLG
jgi:ZIP family zinc transporter